MSKDLTPHPEVRQKHYGCGDQFGAHHCNTCAATERAAQTAVSARRINRPSDAATQPESLKAARSASVHPPSGPIKRATGAVVNTFISIGAPGRSSSTKRAAGRSEEH